jgi:hypothetical protein
MWAIEKTTPNRSELACSESENAWEKTGFFEGRNETCKRTQLCESALNFCPVMLVLIEPSTGNNKPALLSAVFMGLREKVRARKYMGRIQVGVLANFCPMSIVRRVGREIVHVRASTEESPCHVDQVNRLRLRLNGHGRHAGNT